MFVPPNPKIEPGDCVIWRAASGTHSILGERVRPRLVLRITATRRVRVGQRERLLRLRDPDDDVLLRPGAVSGIDRRRLLLPPARDADGRIDARDAERHLPDRA